MKFINDLYQVISFNSYDDEKRFVVLFNPNHQIYSVHFPNNPITPGNVLLQIATVLLERNISKRLSLNTAKNIKFKKPVTPTAKATFIYHKLNITDNQLSININIEVENISCVQMSLIYNIINYPNI